MPADPRVVRARISNFIHRTAVTTSATLDRTTGTRLFFKCENFQKTGSFKARGASNLVSFLSDEEARRGLAAHSSGNHAAALSYAAQLRGIPAHVVMPRDAPEIKQAQVRRYGGILHLCEPNYDARKEACARIMAETGAVLAHSSDDERVIAGQGTVGLELIEDLPDLDLILCPIGGGGLASGLVLAMRALRSRTHVIAVEPAQADDAFRSLREGRLLPPSSSTIADGLRTGLGANPFAILREHLEEIVTVSEESIAQAMRMLWEVLKLIVEPSGAVPFAALLEGRVPSRYSRIGIILSGGNLDLTNVPWIPRANGANIETTAAK